MTAGIAIPQPQQFPTAVYLERQGIIGSRHCPTFGILNFRRDQGNVLAICQEPLTVGAQHDFRRRTGGLPADRERLPSVLYEAATSIFKISAAPQRECNAAPSNWSTTSCYNSPRYVSKVSNAS